MNNVKAGSNIDAWCTKCRLILAHTIEAVVGDSIKRVVCNTCRGKHQFKAFEPNSGKSTSVRVSSKSPSKPKSRVNDYEKLLSNKDVTKAVSYGIRNKYKKGEVIDHKSFGFGVVIEERDSNKIEVLFDTGPKILIHGK